MSKTSLKYRIGAALFIQTAIILAIVLSQVMSLYFKGSRDQIARQEQTSLELLGEFARIALLTTDYEAFQPQLEQVASLPNVSVLMLADDRGIIVAASNPVLVGRLASRQGTDEENGWQALPLENITGSLGVLSAKFSSDALMALHRKIRSTALQWSLAGLFLIAVGSVLTSHLLTRRLEQVTRAAAAVAEGDLTAQAAVSGQDEVAELGRVFDSMVQTIKDDRVQREEREQYLALTLNSIGDAVIATDSEGHITRMNPVAETLTGWSAANASGRLLPKVFRIVNAHTRETVENPVDKVLRSGKIVGLANHTVLINQNGTEYQIADSGAPIRDEDGEVLGVILVFRDVTQQYQTEEALRRSQKMEAIGLLAGGIAHDFNNRLSVIIGYLDFLRNYVANDEKPSQWVDTATRAAQRCTDLTRQLLTFSSRRSEKKKVVDLNTVLKEIKTMISRSVTPEVEVQYFLADDLWPIEIDPGEFQDAVLNLVINARDAMPGSGSLLIETGNKFLDADYVGLNPDIEAGDYVQLMLSDTGTGMDSKTLEHIFEPFFTTKPKGKGTGLGMSMVYGCVKRYGGYIKVYSELGAGTTFHLYMPRSLSTAADIPVNNNPEAALPTGNETILIVDDEVDLLQLADQYLSELGYQIHTAENAAQALEILTKEDDIDLLFSDVVMPGGMNGYELAQLAVQQRTSMKVLLSSGFTSKIIARNGLARFSAHLLNKPYRKADLAQRIRLVLDEKSMT